MNYTYIPSFKKVQYIVCNHEAFKEITQSSANET